MNYFSRTCKTLTVVNDTNINYIDDLLSNTKQPVEVVKGAEFQRSQDWHNAGCIIHKMQLQ